MRKTSYILFFLAAMLCVGMFLSGQQMKFPRVSPGASVTQTIGLCEVAITYHRPGVKGRQIWGGLVPYEEVWRAGANEITTIRFACNVKIDGRELAAGTYGFLVIPHQEKGATLIFSKQTDIWGNSGYKQEMDALRIDVPTEKAEYSEWMMYYFTDLSDSSAAVVLQWENVCWKFKIEVDTQGTVIKDAERAFGRYWLSPYQAANYAFEKDTNMAEALKWVELSTKIEENYWNMALKAKIYKKMAKTNKDHGIALKMLEKAIMLGKKMTPEQQKVYVAAGEELLKTWKSRK